MKNRVYVPYLFGLGHRPIPYQYENVARRLPSDRFGFTCHALPECEELGVAHIEQVPLSDSSAISRRLKIARTALRPYDVLHTGGSPALTYFVSRAVHLRNRDLTHVHTLHIDVAEHDDREKRFKRRLVRMADVVTAVSDHTAQTAATEFGIEPTVVYNGIDVQYYRPDREAPACLGDLAPSGPVFLFVGKLEPRKRPLDVVELARRLPESTFLIRGSGSLERRVRAAADERSNLVLLDRLPKLELARLYANVDGLVFPSTKEGCPTVVLEALASGTPVVGYEATSMPELVQDDDHGYLCPVGDLDALEQAVRSLTDRSLARELGERGRQYVCDEHSFDTVARQYQSFYEGDTDG